MNFKKYILALSVLITFLHLSASAQRDTMSLKTIITLTNKFTHEHPYEKVYMHLDKPYYTVGDTIWFKAYVTIGIHQPSDLSKILYVDIVSARDTFVQAVKLQIVNGTATGSIPLTQPLYKQGNYHLSAYTNWMRNFDPAYFFNKTITIGNPVDNQVITSTSFSGSNKNKQQKITARIQFKDPTGTPYANKKVSWTINNDDDKPLKGKETTDASGFATINIAAGKIPVLASNSLFTTIDLGNRKQANNIFPLRSAVAEADIQFFPEGGSLLTGVRSKVAFKAVSPNGLGADVKGTITDNTGAVAAEFKSQHLGMGNFVFTPEEGKTYKANITFANGSQTVTDLPSIQASGINLAVYNTNADTLSLKITANSAYFQQNQNKVVYIMAQSNGFVLYAAQTVLRSPVFSATIAKSKFPTGVLQVTLFDVSGTPLSERVVFIQRNDMLDLGLTSAAKTYGTRQQVKMQVNAKNKTVPTEAGLSVSVIDETKVPFNEDAETTILTSLLLSSDLKGYIEKPNYYFKKIDATTAADLDVLMLTQGYRRFLYSNILNNKIPGINFLPEQSMEITGTLRNATGMPIAKGNIRLQIPDRYYSTQTTTNMSGEFKFSKLIIPDSSKVILNARNNVNANNLMIMVNGTSLQGISPNFNYPDEVMNIDSTLAPSMKNTQRRYNNSHTLKEVQIVEKVYVKKPGYQDFSALTGLNFPDHSITGDRLKDCPNFAMCLQTMLMGITFDASLNNYYITRDYNQGQKSSPVAIFFNGMQVDYSYIAGLTSPDIESVEVFLNDGVSGINRRDNTKGVIEITTKVIPKGTKVTQDQLAQLFPPKYIATLMPKGFNVSREFYSPKYAGPATAISRPDLRTTIYWNTHLITDKTTGTTAFDFFTADDKGTYKAVVEGMDADGNIGRSVYRFTVK
ncbi:MAG: carboxypeptidase regulatory-like domain-containing protein [Mucilaginibacter sp.]|uniref:carboxypeptidase regulatory-like domain-containing protein n=1 Tax=Mucilaginibacter sp. TaxID=1882438 RepID=UPI00326364C7